MSQRYVPGTLHGLIVYDPYLGAGERSDADSTATQAGPRPGLTSNPDLSDMTLQQGGESWDGETLTLTTLQGGNATPETAVRVTWSGEAGKSGTDTRGWLPFSVATGWMAMGVAAQNIPAGLGTPLAPNAIRLQNGDVLMAFQHTYSGSDYIAVAKYDASAGDYDPSFGRWNGASYDYSAATAWAWVADAVDKADLNSSAPKHPCLVELPSGKLLLFFVSQQSYRGGTSYWCIGLATSEDAGATWTLAAKDTGARVLAATGTPTRLAVAWHNGYLTALLVHDNGGSGSDFSHFYSPSNGASWVEVDDAYPGTPLWSPCIIGCDDGTALVAWIDDTGECVAARKTTPGSAIKADPFTIHPNTGASVTKYSEGNDRLAMCLGTERTIHLMGIAAATGATSERLRYARFFQTVSGIDQAIELPGEGDQVEGEPIDYADGIAGAQHPYARTLVAWGERLLLLWEIPTSKVVGEFFGGYSTIDWNGPTFGGYDPTTFSRYGMWWDASYVPSTVAAWTSSGVGTEGSSVEQALSLDFSGGASTRIYSRTGTAAAPALMWARHRQDSGGDLGFTYSGLKLRVANGTYDYDIAIRFSTTGIRMVDENNASATVGTDATGLTSGAVYDVMVSLTGTGRAVCWYKLATSQVWTQGPTGNVTNDSATPNAASLVAWGHAVLSTQKSTWFFVGSCVDDYGAMPASISEPNQPQITFGREVTLWPAYLADGRTVRASSVSAVVPETWAATPAFDTPVDALDPLIEPSPSVAWRSTDDQTEQVIGWSFGAAYQPLSASLGLYLRNPNFTSIILERYSAGSWVSIATVSTVSISGDFSRTGYLVLPTGEVGSKAVSRNELVGSWVVLTDTGTGDAYYRRIAANSPGVWSAGADDLPILIEIEGDLTGLPTSGTIEVIAPETAHVVSQAAPGATKIRVRIPARTYASADQDYHTASVLLLGPYLAFGQAPSWGRTMAMEPLQAISTAANGRRRVQRFAPRPRRTVELPFTDPIVAYDIYYGSISAGHATTIAAASSGLPLALAHDPRMVEDLLLGAQGARYPVVYLAALTPPGGTLTQRDLLLYGRVVNPSTRTSIVGTEGVEEAQSISVLRVEEEL